MIERVTRAGYEVPAVTADVAVGSKRQDYARARFSWPPRLTPRFAFDMAIRLCWLGGVLL